MTDEQKAELHRLQKLTVPKLREEAKEKYHDEISGVHGMSKDKLVQALCEQMGIPYDEETHKVATGVGKAGIKQSIKKFKEELAVEGRGKQDRLILRKRVKRLKRKLRHAA